MNFDSASTWAAADAERAFEKALRARRRAALMHRLRRGCAACARLTVHELRSTTRRGSGGVVRDISLDAITGSLEPSRAAQFDREFRPSALTRGRWLSVWHAERRGTVLPPISVVALGDGYAIRDGHHRVSVARARGARSIRAAIA